MFVCQHYSKGNVFVKLLTSLGITDHPEWLWDCLQTFVKDRSKGQLSNKSAT